MNIDFEGRVVLVTGASSGLGRACAVQLSRSGAKVALMGRRPDALEETRQMLAGQGHAVYPLNLQEHAQIVPTVQTIAQNLGSLDLLVHAAGMHATLPIKALDPQTVNDLFKINVFSFMWLVKGFRDKRIVKRHPSVVALASVAGLVGQIGGSTYSASKGALLSLVRSFALELAGEGIRFNAVAPGVVDTSMSQQFRSKIGDNLFQKVTEAHPLGLGQPDDVASAVTFLLSPQARWITGTTLVVDGGYTAQ